MCDRRDCLPKYSERKHSPIYTRRSLYLINTSSPVRIGESEYGQCRQLQPATVIAGQISREMRNSKGKPEGGGGNLGGQQIKRGPGSPAGLKLVKVSKTAAYKFQFAAVKVHIVFLEPLVFVTFSWKLYFPTREGFSDSKQTSISRSDERWSTKIPPR